MLGGGAESSLDGTAWRPVRIASSLGDAVAPRDRGAQCLLAFVEVVCAAGQELQPLIERERARDREICVYLDGLPLALQLAPARLRVLRQMTCVSAASSAEIAGRATRDG